MRTTFLVAPRYATPQQRRKISEALSIKAFEPEVKATNMQHAQSPACPELMQKLEVLRVAYDRGLLTLSVYEQKQMQLLAAL